VDKDKTSDQLIMKTLMSCQVPTLIKV